MGYTTDFSGSIAIEPPLNAEEIEYLTKFAGSRRMARAKGPYYADDPSNGSGSDIINHNAPPAGQPGLWCQWVPTSGGTAIEWDGGEKFYNSAEWMKYLIEHFLKPGAFAKSALPFLQANHICNGKIEAQGEDSDDRWRLVVRDNKVFTQPAVIEYHTASEQEV